MDKKLFDRYSEVDLKNIFNTAIDETKDFIKRNGLVNEDENEFAGFISELCVDSDGILYHHLDLPWASDIGCSPRLHYSKRFSILTSVPDVHKLYEEDYDNLKEMQDWYENYAKEFTEFITFEDFLNLLENS